MWHPAEVDDYEHIIILRDTVDDWRHEHDILDGQRLAVMFSDRAALHFVGLDPSDFDLWPVCYLDASTIHFELPGKARSLFYGVFPGALELF